MHGYRVTLHDLSVHDLESSTYSVSSDGSLVVSGGDAELARWGSGDWLTVDEFGTRLSERWPSPRLYQLLDDLASILAGKFGHYVHQVRCTEHYEDWRYNDLDELTLAVLTTVGITNDRTDEGRSVRDSIAAHFGIPR